MKLHSCFRLRRATCRGVGGSSEVEVEGVRLLVLVKLERGGLGILAERESLGLLIFLHSFFFGLIVLELVLGPLHGMQVREGHVVNSQLEVITMLDDYELMVLKFKSIAEGHVKLLSVRQ